MKRRFDYKTFLLFFVLGPTGMCLVQGCLKKPLDQNPSGEYTTANYWRNQDDVIAGVLGIYNILFTEDWIGHDLYAYDDQSDDICVDGDHPDFKAIERFNADPTLQLIYITWPFAYEQIGRANNAILYIPKVPVMDSSIRARSMGEAYFLRGYAYFILSQIYGEVPIITEKNLSSADYNVAKSSVDSVRAQAESDFLQAANLLPETYDDADKGRVPKGAAWGMLCKLYMFEDKFQQAINYGSQVVSDANYALAANYAFNFTLGQQESNTEILFAVWNKNQEIANVPASAISTYFTPRAWQGWGFHHPTQNFADEFEAADTIRKKATLIQVGDSIPNQTNMTTIGTSDAYQMFTGDTGLSTGRMLPSMSTTGYCIRKYTAFMPSGDGGVDYDLKQPLLRSADVYLLVAEAKIRLHGAGSGDAELNAVRTRAGLAPVAGAGMPQLIHERRVELAGENIRWQDLLRWDKDQIINLDTIVSKPKAASLLPPYNGTVIIPARTFVRPKDYYMPLPQEIIDESKGVILQNSNY
ncbi:RagB/SusD family nutrient uptake outer membrane protein [Dinghuibacter silviterrae]|uniref:Putative outer membrane starch-binding protein n=1 Tax=Dinghuibacter silviterrae TaxID=1539049 RepID=A0A4R8DJC7_9BACT|nr:RagB/SusD family nutrient uptake outer membrane protein [Dinghuibacter silviterrae]TDW97424.1 putative outer membrane starch-binding protein [Dinghuibacter silviterrae]